MKRTTIGNDRGMSFIQWFINTFLHPVDARLNFNFFWWWYYKQCQRRWIRRKNLISRCKKVIPLDSNKNILLRKSNHVFIRIYHRINKQCVKILVNRTQSKQTVFIFTLTTNSSYRKNPQQKKNYFQIYSVYTRTGFKPHRSSTCNTCTTF